MTTKKVDPLSLCYDAMLPAAMRIKDSRGRVHPEPEHEFRSPFQRDRDRVLHSASFRRLEYKTQVFVNGEGDHYRTRLTHTLEVTQISRTMARALHINEDFAEAVAMSHDLGHTPFGHAGEKLLNKLMKDHGGFNHNVHGLRVVDLLEKRYADFDGLNLSYEVREAFVRHGGAEYGETGEFNRDDAPLLEVATTILSDDIAYLAHDIDDGLFSGILEEEALRELEIWRKAGQEAVPHFASYPPSLKRVEGVRRLINILVTDAVEATQANIRELQLDSAEKVRAAKKKVINFSEKIEKQKKELKSFLFLNFYRHPKVLAVMEDRQKKLACLFETYVRNPEKMPEEYQKSADMWGIMRSVADYAAGMTDRYATDEANRILADQPSPEKK